MFWLALIYGLIDWLGFLCLPEVQYEDLDYVLVLMWLIISIQLALLFEYAAANIIPCHDLLSIHDTG